MLFTLFLWLYTSVITFLAGTMLLQLGRRLVGPVPVLAVPMVCLLGAIAITAVLGWAWLVVPINLTIHLILAGMLAGYAIWRRPQLRWHFPRWKRPALGGLTVGVLLTVIWLRSVQMPRLADTGGYHAPMIEWIYRYAVVPGLANLNYRFGFNNSWFLLNALFRFQLTPDVPWHGLNGWLLVMMGWFSLTEWHRWYASQRTFSAWMGGWAAPLLLLIFHWTLSSPSPDLPTHVYVILCFWVWLRRAEVSQPACADSWAWLLLLVGLSALTTKLSAVTVLLLPVLATAQTLIRGNRRRLQLTGILGGTLLMFTGYWWIGTSVLSGYIAYPSLSPLADWFSVDWKVPRNVITVGLQNLQQGTRGDLGTAFSLAWVPYWFKTRPALDQMIFVALLAAPLPTLWFREHAFSTIPGYTIALLTAWLGVIFWFLLAPEIRFGAGTIIITLGLSYGPMLNWRAEKWAHTQSAGLGACLLVGLALVLAAVRRDPVDWLMPTGYPDGQLQTYQAGLQTVRYPTGDLRVINGIRGYWGNCYDAALPCSPYPMPGLQWRGRALQNGFRTVQSNSH